jgi:UDPglucose 6-dehydrogenase
VRLSVIGLGKLGSPLAAVFAAKGHSVVGVDVDERAVAALSDARAPVEETGLQAVIDRARGRLSATSDHAEAIAKSDATFVIVPTPSDADGTFSLKYVLDSIGKIGDALRSKNGRHLVVITSTVMPGATGGPIQQTLEERSGRTVGDDLGLCYSPEFIALGSVVADLLNPDFVLVGESSPWAGESLAEIMFGVCENRPPIMRMNIVDAELAKIAVNTFVTTKISYANMLAEMCEGLPGADVDVVTSAIGLDSRIGRAYLRGATPYGGPCFPRDNIAFGRLARSLGTEADIAEATDRVNRRQHERLARRVLDRLPPGGRIAILGLAYKRGTGVVEESAGMCLASLLADKGHPATVYDPAGVEGAQQSLGDRVRYAASIAECVADADVIVVATDWRDFAALGAVLDGSDRRPVIFDCWRMFKPGAVNAEIVHLGKGPKLAAVRPPDRHQTR